MKSKLFAIFVLLFASTSFAEGDEWFCSLSFPSNSPDVVRETYEGRGNIEINKGKIRGKLKFDQLNIKMKGTVDKQGQMSVKLSGFKNLNGKELEGLYESQGEKEYIPEVIAISGFKHSVICIENNLGS